MAITTADIQWLRQETGVGMMDAKRALEATNGDREAALEQLRKSGAKVAAAKSARTVKDGRVVIARSADLKSAAIVAVACETDFVAKTEDFTKLVEVIAQTALTLTTSGEAVNAETVMAASLEGGTVREAIESAVAKLGENIQLVEAGGLTAATLVGEYLHGSKRTGAIVALGGTTDDALAHDIAMNITAMRPLYVTPANVPDDVRTHEEEIFRAQLQSEGKPEAMWDKILPGKMAKYYAEVCAVQQPFIKDDKQTLAHVLAANGNTTITNFVRLTV